MYIEPNTTIRLLKNCPLDNTYDHTIWFADKSSQTSYFRGLTKYVLSEQTYQRVNKGRMRVQYKADDIYDCNYLMFQNSNYGSKWFYAFIKSVEYVNNITSEIEFEIDVMQTWFFDYTLGECFVEREHVGSDKIGEHTVPENIEIGEYVTDDFDGTQKLGARSIVVATTFDANYDDTGGMYYGGMFQGLNFHVFENSLNGAQAAASFIQNAGTKTDGIVCVFMMPTSMVTKAGEQAASYTISKPKKYTLKRYDGSNVKNNKLYCYPYNFLYVSNLQGTSAAFRYEFFSSDECNFTLTGDMTANPSVILAPNNYKGAAVNYDEKLTLSSYPQLSYITDTFKAWLAQQGANVASSAIAAPMTVANGTITGAMRGGALGAYVGTFEGTINATSNMINQVQNVVSGTVPTMLMPDQAHGVGSPSTLAATGLLDFAFMHKHIRPEYISIVDDYFTMFGYARRRVKVPNRHVRKYWTYTKTIGCDIHGSVPADDMNKICSIYNNGITFWTNGDNIGNYSLDNSII